MFHLIGDLLIYIKLSAIAVAFKDGKLSLPLNTFQPPVTWSIESTATKSLELKGYDAVRYEPSFSLQSYAGAALVCVKLQAISSPADNLYNPERLLEMYADINLELTEGRLFGEILEDESCVCYYVGAVPKLNVKALHSLFQRLTTFLNTDYVTHLRLEYQTELLKASSQETEDT